MRPARVCVSYHIHGINLRWKQLNQINSRNNQIINDPNQELGTCVRNSSATDLYVKRLEILGLDFLENPKTIFSSILYIIMP